MNQVLNEEWQRHLVSVLEHWAQMAKESIAQAAAEQMRPAVSFKPRLSIDGDQWCALYGDDLQSGVAGFGKSPEEAMWDFDKAWSTAMTQPTSQKGGA